jgi:uncharacterized protein YwbE
MKNGPEQGEAGRVDIDRESDSEKQARIMISLVRGKLDECTTHTEKTPEGVKLKLKSGEITYREEAHSCCAEIVTSEVPSVTYRAYWEDGSYRLTESMGLQVTESDIEARSEELDYLIGVIVRSEPTE